MSRNVHVDVIATDKATRTFDKVAASADKTASKLTKIQKRMSDAGKTLTKHVTLPIIALGAESAKSAIDFQAAMEKVRTGAGGSQKDVASLSKQILNMKDAQQGPQAMAEAMYHLKSVGLDNKAAMGGLRSAMDLANVSGANLEETTNALAGAWRSGIRGATNMGQAAGTLNAIVGAGNMKMTDLIGALGTGILPAAKTFGLSLKDVGGALALLTDEGVPADAAATRLRMTFSLLGAPSKAAEKQLKTIGLTGLQLANAMRGPKGLIGAVGLLKEHLDKSGLSLAKQSMLLSHAFGGGRSSATLMSLLNNYDVLNKKQVQINKNVPKFGAAVQAQSKTAAAKWSMMTADLQRTGVKVGNIVVPIVETLTHWVSKLADGFSGLSPTMQHVIVIIAAVAAAVGPLLLIGAKVVGVIKAISGAMEFLAANPVVLIIAAVAALVVGLVIAYKRSELFRRIVSDAMHAVVVAAKAVASFFTKDIPKAWDAVVHGLKVAWDKAWAFLKTWGPVALAVLAPFIGIPLLIAQHFRQIVGWLRGVWNTVVGDVRDVVGRVVGWVESLPGRLLRAVGAMLRAGRELASNLWSGLSTILSDAANIGRDLYNTVAGVINRDLIDKIRGWHFTIGAFGIHHTFEPFGSIPEIPYLATGGMTTGRTLAMIGDNPSGRELVMPMDSPRTVAMLAAALRQAQGDGHTDGGGAGKIADHLTIVEASDPVRTARTIARYQRARAAV